MFGAAAVRGTDRSARMGPERPRTLGGYTKAAGGPNAAPRGRKPARRPCRRRLEKERHEDPHGVLEPEPQLARAAVLVGDRRQCVHRVPRVHLTGSQGSFPRGKSLQVAAGDGGSASMRGAARHRGIGRAAESPTNCTTLREIPQSARTVSACRWLRADGRSRYSRCDRGGSCAFRPDRSRRHRKIRRSGRRRRARAGAW